MTSKVMQQWLATAPEWMLNGPEWLNTFFYKLFKCFIYDDRYMLFLKGLGNTLILTFFALLIGIVLGVIASMIRVSWDKTGKSLHGAPKFFLRLGNAIAQVYLTVIRGTPVVVQIMIMFFVVFASSRNKLLVGALSFGINSGAYVAEIIRGGIMSVDEGQMEAGRSLGFGYVPTMRYIILPQAFRAVVPTLLSQVITTIKDSSYLANLACIELMSRVRKILSTSNMYNGVGRQMVSDVFVLFGTAFVIYFVINFSLSCAVRSMRRRRAAPAQVRQQEKEAAA